MVGKVIVRGMNIKFVDSAIVRTGPRALSVDEIPQLIIQDRASKICGPTCVAMALDCRPDDLLAKMKSKGGGTRTKQLVAVLKEYYDVDDSLTVVKDGIPDRSVLKITFSWRNQGHWSLLWNGFVFDPGWGTFPKHEWECSLTANKCRVTSYLELRNK